MWAWVTFCFNPNCYLIVHGGLQVQPFPNDLRPSPPEEKNQQRASSYNLLNVFFPGERTLCIFLCYWQKTGYVYCHWYTSTSVCECLTRFLNHTLNHMWIKFSNVFSDVLFLIRPYDHCSCQYCLILVFHCTCRKLHIQFCASAVCLLAQLSSPILAGSFILSPAAKLWKKPAHLKMLIVDFY